MAVNGLVRLPSRKWLPGSTGAFVSMSETPLVITSSRFRSLTCASAPGAPSGPVSRCTACRSFEWPDAFAGEDVSAMTVEAVTARASAAAAVLRSMTFLVIMERHAMYRHIGRTSIA